MPAKWTGRVVGLMHIHGITHAELAKEAGLCRSYTTMLLNKEKVNDKSRERITDALDRLIDKRGAE